MALKGGGGGKRKNTSELLKVVIEFTTELLDKSVVHGVGNMQTVYKPYHLVQVTTGGGGCFCSLSSSFFSDLRRSSCEGTWGGGGTLPSVGVGMLPCPERVANTSSATQYGPTLVPVVAAPAVSGGPIPLGAVQ